MISAAEMTRRLNLAVLVPPPDPNLPIETGDINRPGLQLAGYMDFFAYERCQILGKVETAYLNSLDPATRIERLEAFFSYALPCVIICRGIQGQDDLTRIAARRRIPVFQAEQTTTKLVVDIISFLNNKLAPSLMRHGVLVDVYGVGILITGESGVGKSEAALELVKRGHQLVADDVVDIRRVNDTRLIGESPEMIRHFMEIRGVGIIDIATMYGIGAVLRTKSIDMVVHLETWKQDKEYDRLGLEELYEEILEVRVPKIVLPIRPGRNLAIVLEVAARNLRLKQQGHNAAKELDKRFSERLKRSAEDNDDVLEE